ncbi:hypothetical protein GQ43DRAFT_439993 [Delitschia confertaspora ATCC 74209]|uniref:Uncharacterized protein n=1 Tax=Delitschia confertaspora ATCC 74209 TaxID=1513339 RepID=A0A9P4JPN4_9PLEO|nr:hypothetical protein GQ43DRAFT_439993 [Delitschia confertaspora ATCC 74209]
MKGDEKKEEMVEEVVELEGPAMTTTQTEKVLIDTFSSVETAKIFGKEAIEIRHRDIKNNDLSETDPAPTARMERALDDTSTLTPNVFQGFDSGDGNEMPIPKFEPNHETENANVEVSMPTEKELQTRSFALGHTESHPCQGMEKKKREEVVRQRKLRDLTKIQQKKTEVKTLRQRVVELERANQALIEALGEVVGVHCVDAATALRRWHQKKTEGGLRDLEGLDRKEENRMGGLEVLEVCEWDGKESEK